MSPDQTTRTIATPQQTSRISPKRDQVGISWNATPIPSGAPPVTILGSTPRHQGGFRIDA